MKILFAILSLLYPQFVPTIPANSGAGSSPPTFVNSAECTASSAASCTKSSLSIPSGDIIVTTMVAAGGSGMTLSASDSNSDTFNCTSSFNQPTSGDSVGGCAGKAGATVTSVTCTKSVSGQNHICEILWYSPGSLSGAVDQAQGHAENPNTTWNTGATGTLATSNELVVDIWSDSNTGRTTTYSDSTTQRTTCSTQVSCGISDRNVSSTSAVTGSGTPNAGNSFQIDEVFTVK